MKKVQITIGIGVAICFLALAVVRWAPLPTYPVPDELPEVVLSDSISLFAGKRLAMTICSHCHYNQEYGTLAGRRHGNPGKLGTFFSGNITSDTTYGTGHWTEAELYYFLRTGVRPDGSFVFDMPKYPNLSENDLKSLIAFLKSDDALVAPTSFYNPPPRYSLVTRALYQLWLRPPRWNGRPVAEPDTTNAVAHGRYLSAQFSCFECHSGNAVTNNYLHPEMSWRYFRGGNPHVDEDGNKIVAPALHPDHSDWQREDFIQTLRTGTRPDGHVLRDPMIPFPVLTHAEADAIFTYLQSYAQP